MEFATLPIQLRKPKKDDERVLEFVGSTDHVDRMGDVIKQNWDLSPYRKNPVFLWGHRYSDLPIGKAVRVWKETISKTANAAQALLFKIAFAPAEIHPFAEQVRGLYEAGFLSATSVGFRPLARMQLDEKMREEMGLGPWGQVFTKSELLELSAVTVPANPNALKKGALTDAFGDRAGGLFFDLFKGVEVPQDELAERYFSGLDEKGLLQFLAETKLAIGEFGEPDRARGVVPLTIDDEAVIEKLADIPEEDAVGFLSSYFANEKAQDEDEDEDEDEDIVEDDTDEDLDEERAAFPDLEDETEDRDGEDDEEVDEDEDDDDDDEIETDLDDDDDDDDDEEEKTFTSGELKLIPGQSTEDIIARTVAATIAALEERGLFKTQPGNDGGKGQTADDDDDDEDDDDLDDVHSLLSDANALAEHVGASK